LEEEVKQGRRPPLRRKLKKDPAAIAKEEHLKSANEMPFSTHVSLPILNPPSPPEAVEPSAPMDSEDAAEG
jgi:hypothetical protein